MDTVVTLLDIIALLTPLRSEVGLKDLQEIAVTKCEFCKICRVQRLKIGECTVVRRHRVCGLICNELWFCEHFRSVKGFFWELIATCVLYGLAVVVSSAP